MNIAILIPSLATGGAERAAVILGNYYVDHGHAVYYFLFANSGRVSFDAKGNIIKTHVAYPFSENLREKDNVRELFFAARSFRKLKKIYNIDVSISFMEGANFVNVCSRSRDKIIISVRTVLSERHEISGIPYDSKWIRRVYSKADKLVSVSDYVKDDLSRHYKLSRSSIVSIPNVSYVHKPLDENQEWNYGDYAILSVGRLDPVKQQDRIIRSFQYVHKSFPSSKLIIIGDGKQRDYLENICNEMGVEECVVFVGSTKDVGFYLSHARAFVMASRVEGFPNAMVEAMAYSVPVITTDSPGGCGEIVGRMSPSKDIQYCEYGIVTPYMCGECPRSTVMESSEELLGEAMLKLLTDDELYKQFSLKSKERSEYYKLDNIMTKWNDVIGVK